MKKPQEVQLVNEETVDQLRGEAEALRFVLGLFDGENGANVSPADTLGGRPAVRLLKNSERLEIVVEGTPSLRFAGRMSTAVEVMRTGNEIRIFVPIPQSSDSSFQLEEGAA
jgi:virulence-associated protein VagC